MLRLSVSSLTRSVQQETALINSGNKTRRPKAQYGNGPRSSKAQDNIRPRDVRFAWLKDLYTCGDDHLDGCSCEETLGVFFLSLES